MSGGSVVNGVLLSKPMGQRDGVAAASSSQTLPHCVDRRAGGVDLGPPRRTLQS